MIFNRHGNKRHRKTTYFVLEILLAALFIISLPASAEYEQSLEELRDKLGAIQENEELDSYLLKAYSGDLDAQFKLGALYSSGESGVVQDHEQAIYWYKKAAEQGHDSAQYNLGHKYLEGKGVEKDINKAIEWWKKAAEQQHELAQFNLGRAYYLGIGTAKDTEKSRYWFTQAANNNEVRSIAILKKMNWDTPATNKRIEEATSTQAIQAEPNEASKNAIAETNKKLDESESSIAIYTNPAIKPLLITIAKSKEDINVLAEQDKWLKINSKIGLPVWTHQDFIEINGNIGTITGTNVNSRSVPMITRGSIVGRLNKKEQVRVIEQKGEWVRILSPNRFKGWIKKYDYRFLLDAPAEETAEIETEAETQTETSNDYKLIDSYYDKIKKAPPVKTIPDTTDDANTKWKIN